MTITPISSKAFFAGASYISYQGVEIEATASDLISILGDIERHDECDKAQFNWFIRLDCEDGSIIFAAVYDWKEYYDFGLGESIRWHIGASSQEDSQAVADALNALLNL